MAWPADMQSRQGRHHAPPGRPVSLKISPQIQILPASLPHHPRICPASTRHPPHILPRPSRYCPQAPPPLCSVVICLPEEHGEPSGPSSPEIPEAPSMLELTQTHESPIRQRSLTWNPPSGPELVSDSPLASRQTPRQRRLPQSLSNGSFNLADCTASSPSSVSSSQSVANASTPSSVSSSLKERTKSVVVVRCSDDANYAKQRTQSMFVSNAEGLC